jgi:hypothetical protein
MALEMILNILDEELALEKLQYSWLISSPLSYVGTLKLGSSVLFFGCLFVGDGIVSDFFSSLYMSGYSSVLIITLFSLFGIILVCAEIELDNTIQ